MDNFRFTLEPYKGAKSRHTCPSCGKSGTFTRYIDTETDQYLSDEVGRCNRENSCGYHNTPKQYFKDSDISSSYKHSEIRNRSAGVKSIAHEETSYVDIDVVNNSLKGYTHNNFILFCIDKFGVETTDHLVSQYFVGSSSYWQGATIFWQVDINYNVRAGKIMLYNPLNCKRVKEPFNHITWSHTAFNHLDFNLSQCLFGEHLLNDDKVKPVAIVESEKTAIIANVYMPMFIWLAAGSINNLKLDKCTALENRKVVLYPDIKAFDKWNCKAKDLANIASVQVSNLLETHATDSEREKGLDLADYLLKFEPPKMGNELTQFNMSS